MTARQQLDGFLKRYDPAIAKLGNAAVAALRKRLPPSDVLVYDNYNALVIGFCGTDRPSDAFLSVALYPKWVRLFFLHGATLPDPNKLLEGSGAHVRSIRLGSVAMLDEPAVAALIQSVSAKQRPRTHA